MRSFWERETLGKEERCRLLAGGYHLLHVIFCSSLILISTFCCGCLSIRKSPENKAVCYSILFFSKPGRSYFQSN